MDRAPDTVEKRKLTHRWRWVVAVLVVLLASAWGVMSWAGTYIVKRMDGELANLGLVLKRQWVTWDPLRGLHLQGAALLRTDGQPLVRADGVNVGFPLGQFFGKSALVSDWQVSDADVSLYDAKGEVKLEDVSLDLRVKGTELEVASVTATKDGLVAKLEGQIFLKERAPEQQDEPISLKLNAVRATLAALEMERGRGKFEVTGKFSVDTRPGDELWNAELKGSGGEVVWKGVPMKKAQAEAKLTQGKSLITVNLVLPQGGVDLSLTREDWDDAPFLFSGTLRDARGREDAYNGKYSTKDRTLTIDKLDGAADLWTLAGDIPMVAAKLPEEISFKEFPEVSVRNLQRIKDGDEVRWNVQEVETKGKVLVSLRDKQALEISNVSGGAAYDGKTWRLKKVEGRLLDGQMTVSGGYRDKGLRDAQVSLEGMKLSDLKEWMEGEKSSSAGVLYVEYRGDVDLSGKSLEGKGAMRLENAPVIETPLLDETYDLFAQLIPGVERADSGEFQAEFTGEGRVVEVTKFEAKGGALTVSAKGTINLKTEQVKGSARGKMGGIPGLVTSPLSRLLEMNVEGPVDNIRVKPLGPVKIVSNLASGTVGVAVDTVQETGRITGEVLKEGVKLPMKWFQKKK